MDFFFAVGHGEGFAAVGRDQVELGGLVFGIGIGIGILALSRGRTCARRGRRSSGRRATIWVRSRGPTALAGSGSLFAVVAIEPESLRKICWSQSARSVSMTTELPSGEISRAVKLTELKNSSRVSLGLFWAVPASVHWRRLQGSERHFAIRMGPREEGYTTAGSLEASLG